MRFLQAANHGLAKMDLHALEQVQLVFSTHTSHMMLMLHCWTTTLLEETAFLGPSHELQAQACLRLQIPILMWDHRRHFRPKILHLWLVPCQEAPFSLHNLHYASSAASHQLSNAGHIFRSSTYRRET